MTGYTGKGRPRNGEVSFYKCLHRLSGGQKPLAIHPLPQLKDLALRMGGISTWFFGCKSEGCTEKKCQAKDPCVQDDLLTAMLLFPPFTDHFFFTFWTSFINSAVLMRPKSLIHEPSSGERISVNG